MKFSAVMASSITASALFVWPAFVCSAATEHDKTTAISYKVGMSFRRFTPKEPYNWRGAKNHALNTVVWYPADPLVLEKPVEIPGLSIFELGSAAQGAKVVSKAARLPLVVVSHGTGGSGLRMAWLGEALAAHGYIVAAVNHPGNNAAEPYTVEGFSIWWERARDLSEVVSGMLSDAEFGAHIDASHFSRKCRALCLPGFLYQQRPEQRAWNLRRHERSRSRRDSWGNGTAGNRVFRLYASVTVDRLA